MRVSDFFPSTPATRADAEAALRSSVGDASSETPTTEIVSGEGDKVLHDTIVQETAETTAGDGGTVFAPSVEACGCPEGECRGSNPTAVKAAFEVAAMIASAQGISPEDLAFGKIAQDFMDEVFGKGNVTVSGPYTDGQDGEPVLLSDLESKLEVGGLRFSSEELLASIFGGQQTQAPADPFPSFSGLSAEEIEKDRRQDEMEREIEEADAFEAEGREVVQSLTATMEQLVRLATTVYGE